MVSGPVRIHGIEQSAVVSLNCRDEFGCFLSIVAFSMK